MIFVHTLFMKKWWPTLLMFFVIMSGCTRVEEPQFRRVHQFRLKKLGLEAADIGFSVTYFNPNSFGVTVKEAAADVYMDSVYLGKFTQDASIAVEKKSEFSIPMTGSIPLATALKMNLQNMIDRPVTLKADGSVKVGKAGVFITKPFKYEGRHSLAEIKL